MESYSAVSGTSTVNFSNTGAGNGYMNPDNSTAPLPPTRLQSTGYIAAASPGNFCAYCFAAIGGRHSGGANYLLCDGHIKWYRTGMVSTGCDAFHPADGAGDRSGNCAAGTEASAGSFSATFSAI